MIIIFRWFEIFVGKFCDFEVKKSTTSLARAESFSRTFDFRNIQSLLWFKWISTSVCETSTVDDKPKKYFLQGFLSLLVLVKDQCQQLPPLEIITYRNWLHRIARTLLLLKTKKGIFTNFSLIPILFEHTIFIVLHHLIKT